MGLKTSLCGTEDRFDSRIFYSLQKTCALSVYQLTVYNLYVADMQK